MAFSAYFRQIKLSSSVVREDVVVTLEKYRKKWDFARTTEPSGTTELPQKGEREPRRYFIQKHHARSLHYDLRLEEEGVLKKLGGPERAEPRPGRQAARGGSGGPSPGLRRLRGNYPRGGVWRRTGYCLGPGCLRAGGGRGVLQGDVGQGSRQDPAFRGKTERRVCPGPDPLGWKREQLALHQGTGRACPAGLRRDYSGTPLSPVRKGGGSIGMNLRVLYPVSSETGWLFASNSSNLTNP
jgi:hypothetical protein